MFYPRYTGMIERAGGSVGDGYVLLTLYQNGELWDMKTELIYIEPLDEARPFSLTDIAEQLEYIVRHEIIDDEIFLIDLRLFYNGAQISEMVNYIRQAIYDGIRHFIVDLRGNPGGDVTAGRRLLTAMGKDIPGSGFVRRFSPLSMENEIADSRIFSFNHKLTRIINMIADGIEIPPYLGFAGNLFDVYVTALMDGGTYSAATMMASWIADGGFGNLVGTPSANSPSFFAGMLFFNLPYSQLEVSVSSMWNWRPDSLADQNILWPDIIIDPAYALEAAVEHHRAMNRE